MESIHKIDDIHPCDPFYRDRDLLVGNKIIVISQGRYKNNNDGFVWCDFKFTKSRRGMESFYKVKLEKVEL